MIDFKTVLDRAKSDGVISEDQERSLVSYFSNEFDSLSKVGVTSSTSLDVPRDAEPMKAVEDSEAPRFIRGFHDVLITIGIVIALIGVGSLTNVIFVLVGAWILAEILVKRQRLALPAVILTLIYTGAVFSLVTALVGSHYLSNEQHYNFLFASACFPIALSPFYWRFRVPIALAMMIAGFVLLVFAFALFLTGEIVEISDLFSNAPFIVNLVGLVASVVLFAAAMWFDLKDRSRVKRWSDVAFWLHLISAPALLYNAISLVLYQNTGAFWWASKPSFDDAIIVVLCVSVMMLIGLVIDRRAFVTSGLISLIAAAAIIFKNADFSWGDTTSLALLLVGLLVLVFGIGWQFLRGALLQIMPDFITSRVPPIEKA